MKRAVRTSLSAIVLLSSAHASATVLWSGDLETGDKSQWESAQAASPDRLQVVTSPVHQGKYALRVEVRNGDFVSSGNRAELVRTVVEKEGDDRYYGWSTMWPSDYPSNPTWQLFTQWHHTGSTGSPPFEMYVNGEKMYLRVQASTVLWTAPLERGPWHDFVLHVKWSSSATTGFVELWYDGALVLPKKNVATMYAGQDNYLKQGLYRDATITQVGVLFHDGMTMATTLDDVMPKPASDAGASDAASDAPTDAATDASLDASADAGPIDAAVDASTPDATPVDTRDDAATDVPSDDSLGCGCRLPRRSSRDRRTLAALSALVICVIARRRHGRARVVPSA